MAQIINASSAYVAVGGVEHRLKFLIKVTRI